MKHTGAGTAGTDLTGWPKITNKLSCLHSLDSSYNKTHSVTLSSIKELFKRFLEGRVGNDVFILYLVIFMTLDITMKEKYFFNLQFFSLLGAKNGVCNDLLLWIHPLIAQGF